FPAHQPRCGITPSPTQGGLTHTRLFRDRDRVGRSDSSSPPGSPVLLADRISFCSEARPENPKGTACCGICQFSTCSEVLAAQRCPLRQVPSRRAWHACASRPASRFRPDQIAALTEYDIRCTDLRSGRCK